MGGRYHGGICGQFYDFAWHLAEDDNDEGENEIPFEKVDITEEDSSENLENVSENGGYNFKLDSDSSDKEISIVVINNWILKNDIVKRKNK